MKNHTGVAENAELYNHELSRKVMKCAIEVHRNLGAGLLESAYRQCLAHEMRAAGLDFKTELSLPLRYKGVQLNAGYRLDFLVDYFLVVEVKSVEALTGFTQHSSLHI